MPTTTYRFATSEPLTLQLRLNRGSVQVRATDTTETTVHVTAEHDAEEALRVELPVGGRTLIVDPVRRHRRQRIDVVVELPTGSELHIGTASADVAVSGRVRSADVGTSSGEVTVDEVDGRTQLHSASGRLRAGRIGGALDARTASGSVDVDEAGGHVDVRTASGSVTVGRAGANVSATTASGSLAVREATTGTIDLRSTSGRVDVGVRRGALVWLDLTSTTGAVRSELDGGSGGGDDGGAPDVSIRARSVSGGVTVSSVGAAPATP